MKRFLYKNLRTLIIDIVMLLIVVTSFVLEYTRFSKLSSQIPLYNANIIVSLLPAIITIISISLQIHGDTIFNVKIRDYQKLRNNHYNLLHMVLITSFLFAIELMVQILNKSFSAIVISSVVFVYSIIFTILELPILMKSESSAIMIIKKYIKTKRHYSQSESNVFDRLLKNFIIERGIKFVFFELRNKSIKDNNLLGCLLTNQNEFLYKYLNNILVYKKNNYLNDNEEDALFVLKSCFKNLNDLLDLNDEFNYLIFDNSGTNIYHLASLTYCTHKLAAILNYENEVSNLKRILNLYFWRKDRNDVPTLYINYIATMLAGTLTTGEDWFAKAYRDYDLSPIFADIPEYSLDYLLLMIICFILNSKHILTETKELILSVINEPRKGLNSIGNSWKDMIAKTIENYNYPEKLFFAVEDMMKLSEKLKEHTCDIFPGRVTLFSYDDNVHFSKELVIDYWLQIFLNHPYFYYDKSEIYSFLVNLPVERGDIIAKVFENRYLYNNIQSEKSGSTPFFDLLFDSRSKKKNLTLENALKDFVAYHNSKMYGKNHQPLSNVILNQLKKQEDKAVFDCISKYSLNKNLAFEPDDIFSRNIWLEGENGDFSSLLDLYLKELNFGVNRIIENILKKKIKINLFDGSNYPDSVITQIIDFKPDLMGEHEWRLKYSCNKEQCDLIDIKNIDSLEFLPNGMFAKNNSISINIMYCSDASTPRFATDEEINNIIDAEYIATNGLYTFSQYKGLNSGSFFVTREDLFAKLKDRIIVVPLILKISVNVDKEKILYFEPKKDI